MCLLTNPAVESPYSAWSLPLRQTAVWSRTLGLLRRLHLYFCAWHAVEQTATLPAELAASSFPTTRSYAAVCGRSRLPMAMMAEAPGLSAS